MELPKHFQDACDLPTHRRFGPSLLGPVKERAQIPVPGVFDRTRRHLLETHGAPFLEHGQRGMQRAGNNSGIEALAIQVLAARGVPVDGRGLGRPAQGAGQREIGHDSPFRQGSPAKRRATPEPR